MLVLNQIIPVVEFNSASRKYHVGGKIFDEYIDAKEYVDNNAPLFVATKSVKYSVV